MNESNADVIKMPDGKYVIETQPDAVPFFLYDYELFVGKPMQQHNDMIIDIMYKISNHSKKIKTYNEISNDTTHRGRIWTDQKFIAIWGGIEECPKGDFDIMIDLLEKEMSIKIWKNGYTVEITKVQLESGNWKYNHPDYEKFKIEEYSRGEFSNSKFIPIEWYSGKRKPIKKRKYELEYRQLIHGESLITKFNIYLKRKYFTK